MTPAPDSSLSWSYLGRYAYRAAWDLQEKVRTDASAAGLTGHLFFVEHPPTISLGRGESGENLRFPGETLRSQGYDVVETNRGGKVTYHGPGQLVVYPVIDLRRFRMGVKQYVNALEEVAIRTLESYGIRANRNEGCIGVWVGQRKIASVGIHVRRQWTIHGLALNVETAPEAFADITPCGLSGVRMTSMREEGVVTTVPEVVPRFARMFEEVFGCSLSEEAYA